MDKSYSRIQKQKNSLCSKRHYKDTYPDIRYIWVNTENEITFYLPGNPSEEQYRHFGETLCKDAGIAIEVGKYENELPPMFVSLED